jgi:hypothetical protein
MSPPMRSPKPSHRPGALRPLCSVLLLLPLSACFLANAGADKKISDAVYRINTHTRWGRIQDAALMVQPDYRELFLNRHRQWGREIQVADTEVVNIHLAGDAEHADAFVSYSWYATADMTLHETTLRQQWVSIRNTFALSSEAVVRGDPKLLATPPQASSGSGAGAP